APQAQPQQPGAAAGAAAAQRGRWLGPVAGLLAGGLLGALIFGGAFEGIKLMDVILILLLAAGIVFLLRAMRKPQPQREPLQYAGAGAGTGMEPVAREAALPGGAAPAPATRSFPAGFDAEGFTRQAKRNFLQLQEAHDRGDLAALRDMMTTELFEEI